MLPVVKQVTGGRIGGLSACIAAAMPLVVLDTRCCDKHVPP